MTELRERVANAICLKRYGEEITDEVYISPIERDRCYDLADAAIAAVMQGLEDGRRYRHKARGTEYTLIGVGRAQGTLHDEDSVVLYRGDDGGLWVRHQVEFSDGRFEEIPSQYRKEQA